MNVEDVDVVCLEFLERSLDAETEALSAVAAVVGVDRLAVVAEEGGVGERILCGDDHLVAETGAGGEPFANPYFGLATLVIVGCVEEVTALGVVVVEDGEDIFFGHGAHEGCPDKVLT